MPLSKALAILKDQTGIVVDNRTANDPSFKIELQNRPFWEALDVLARGARARISFYERDGRLALVDRLENAPPEQVSHAGIFRTSVKRLSADLDFDSGLRSYSAVLQIAWEPPFRPLYLEKGGQGLLVQDEARNPLKCPAEGKTQLLVALRSAIEVEVALPVLPRTAKSIGLLQGSFSIIGASKMLPFAFGTLDKLDKGQSPLQLMQEGTTARLAKINLKSDPWTVQLHVTVKGSPQFESHQSWLVHNEVYLQTADGKTRLAPSGQAIDRLTSQEAVVTYYFSDNKDANVKRGNPGDWAPVCVMPAKIVEVPVPFSFQDVPLP